MSTFSRRHALKSLSSGFGYLAFSALAHEAAAKSTAPLAIKPTHFPASAKRVIFLCMRGGPSHLDLFDHKPELIERSGKNWPNREIRPGVKMLGPVEPLRQHGESGLRLSPLMPHLSRHADDLCVINSMHTDLPNHAQAFGQMHTGSFQFVRPRLELGRCTG